MVTKNILQGTCNKCNEAIGVDLQDHDEEWAKTNLTHPFKCPHCKSEGKFLESVTFKWKNTKISPTPSQTNDNHILSSSEVKYGRIILDGKQYAKFKDLIDPLPPKTPILCMDITENRTINKDDKYKRFYFHHNSVKQFKKSDILKITIENNTIKIDKI
jgi:hypothetical protein